MSDIPLRTFGRSRNSRSGYAPLNTEQDEYDGNANGRADGNNHQSMPLQTTATKATVSAARHNHQRWKGKKRQSYQDDPEEHEGLLGDDQGHDSEEEVGRPGPARRPPPEVRPTPNATWFYLTSNSGPLRGRVLVVNMQAVQRTSPEPYRSGLQVRFSDGPVRPTAPKLIRFLSEKFQSRFSPNTVKNQKYNAFTFLPIVFYEQFKFFFNLYFLLVALSQFVPALKIGSCLFPPLSVACSIVMNTVGFIATYIAPLAFVLFVTMGKEAFDDYKRYLRDKEANSTKYLMLEPSGVDTALPLTGGPHTRAVPSSSIRVGDLILLEKNQRVPADLVLLRTSDSSGTCFIRTDQLDGETDWKLRAAVPTCQKLHSDGDLLGLGAEIYGMNPQLPYPVSEVEPCVSSRSSNKGHSYIRRDLHHQLLALPIDK